MASPEEVDGLADHATPSPAEALESSEVRRLVHSSLQKLSEGNRLVITLFYLGGMHYQEIARFLGVPLSTVTGRMHRARKQLKGSAMETIENGLRAAEALPVFAERHDGAEIAQAQAAVDLADALPAPGVLGRREGTWWPRSRWAGSRAAYG
jgi:hypothetical protein